MSTSDSTTGDVENSSQASYTVSYEAKLTLPEDVSLSETEAVIAVTEAISRWESSPDASDEMARVRQFDGVEYDPQRPALGISLRVENIPESAPPAVGYTSIQTLLDELAEAIGADFGAARNVAVIR